MGDTEIGGFGITSKDDLLLVRDIRLVRQSCTPVTVSFEDEAVADFFDEQVDQGRQPEEFGRIWVHSHPGDSAQPSLTDEQTFARCFGRANWALMFILARFGKTYARLRFNTGPGGSLVIPVAVDFTQPFAGSDHEAWFDEYAANVIDPETLFDDVLDQRWETTDLAAIPDEFLDVWADYTSGGADFPDHNERPLETDDILD